MDKKTQALAWSVLPKEFKEETKRLSQYYSRHVSALFGMERQRADNFYREFVSLFGIHNLTSDAEGEEMLMCVKGQAVKLYDIANRAFAINGDKWYQGYMKAMQDLFGSKCLPEEEPKPAEPKVKRHVSVKEACEILGVDEFEATKLVKSKPKATCTDDCKDTEFPHDAQKCGTVYQRRKMDMAAMVAAGILAGSDFMTNDCTKEAFDKLAKVSLACANAIISKTLKDGEY